MTITAALENPFDLFSSLRLRSARCSPFCCSRVLAGAVGWAIVLRDLPFFTHAVGAGAYPVMVLGVIAGVSIAVSALAGAVAFAICLGIAAGTGRARGRRGERRAA